MPLFKGMKCVSKLLQLYDVNNCTTFHFEYQCCCQVSLEWCWRKSTAQVHQLSLSLPLLARSRRLRKSVFIPLSWSLSNIKTCQNDADFIFRFLKEISVGHSMVLPGKSKCLEFRRHMTTTILIWYLKFSWSSWIFFAHLKVEPISPKAFRRYVHVNKLIYIGGVYLTWFEDDTTL